MMIYKIELDVSHEVTHEEVVSFAAEHECDCVLLEENGPAGGNPLYKFTSTNEDMIIKLAEELTAQKGNFFIYGFDPEPIGSLEEMENGELYGS